MAEESGYSGDDDYRGNANQSSSEEGSSSRHGDTSRNYRYFAEVPKKRRRESSRIPKPNHEQFFGDMPRRRRKRRLVEVVAPHQLIIDPYPTATHAMTPGQTPSKTTSLYYTSRWLNQYFLNQTAVTSGSATPEPVKIPEEPIMEKKQVIPLISSRRHVLVEEAISFSPFPRVMIESDIPHRVVHTNAAYLRKYGISTSIFSAPHVANKHDLEVAVGSLFDSSSTTDSLIMYPVWGCDKEADGAPAHVTHYLIEANNTNAHSEESSPSETPTTLLHESNTKNRWNKRPARAIA